MTEHTIEWTVSEDEVDVRIRFSMTDPGRSRSWDEPASGPEIEWLSAEVIETGEDIGKYHVLHAVIDHDWDNDDDLYQRAADIAEGEQQPEPEFERE